MARPCLGRRTFDFAGLELRVIMHMAEPWFLGRDVAVCLDIQNAANAYRRLGADEQSNISRVEVGMSAGRYAVIVSESGLYKLIMRSDKPEARKFQDWVTRDVLPAIRKTGGYLLNEEVRDTAKADDRQAMPLPEVLAHFPRLPKCSAEPMGGAFTVPNPNPARAA